MEALGTAKADEPPSDTPSQESFWTSSATSSLASAPSASGGVQGASGAAASTAAVAELAAQTAKRYGVPVGLVMSVIQHESGFNPAAHSPAGAIGLMQLMPSTAAALGIANPWDPAQNLDGGVRYLAQLLDRYGGDAALALAAYNAGPAAVDAHGGIPPYPETRAYVQSVLAAWSGEGPLR
ncbi:MAG: lytic transglycosylase domain-containing protein [Alicyclobacillus sp.]|nr:lytic transglycosylase domain-containing protein [Alicyclobacillus sp.]